MLSRSTWILVALVVLVMAKIAHFVWAKEVREFETSTLDAWGVPMPVRIAGIAVLFGLVVYGYYTRSKREAARLGQPVIRSSVALFALGSLGLVLALLFFASRG
jgi:H+/gluconate symporter-like permease